ncbi:MAG TPA: hypothetical protein VG939_04365 [Caulobacteraceae bacterium]|nr:hypothetical protein [Caulobacteraceae bacterium]
MSAEVVALIRRADLLIHRFGRWPDFADAELVTLRLDRGDLLSAFRTGDYAAAVHPSATVVFRLADNRFPVGAPDRKETLATLRFERLDAVSIRGFNHQNPILGLGITRRWLRRLRMEMFDVRWGGTAMGHDVRLTCGSIEVAEVCDFAGL